MYYHNVQYYETDKMGIVHHSNYIRWMEEARMNLLSEIECDYVKFEREGIVSPVVSVKCDYKKSVTFGEKIRIDTFVKKVTSVKIVFVYEMYNESNELCTVGESAHCFMKKNGKFLNMKRETPDVYDRFRLMIPASMSADEKLHKFL